MPQGRKKKCGPFRKPGSTNARDAISIPRINQLRASLETGDEETRDPRRLSCRSAKTEGATHLARGTETISFSNQDGFKRKRRRHKRPRCTACRLYLQLAQDKNGNLLVCEAVLRSPGQGMRNKKSSWGLRREPTDGARSGGALGRDTVVISSSAASYAPDGSPTSREWTRRPRSASARPRTRPRRADFARPPAP